MLGSSACLSDVTGTQGAPHPVSRSSCQCSSPQRRNSSQIATRTRSELPSRCARARFEAHAVHGDERSRERDLGSHLGAERSPGPRGSRGADCGLCRAPIACRPGELHEADPGHEPRLYARVEGWRAIGRCGRRGGSTAECQQFSDRLAVDSKEKEKNAHFLLA